jgi:RNA polymerase sigma-70 factor, ECF subfamily
MSSECEADLLARCRQGVPEAWEALFDRHYAAAGRFVFQLSSDLSREDVEEICQETFLTVIRTIATFEGNSAIQTWIFRIAANKAHDFRERRQALKRGGGQTPVSFEAEDPETGLPLDLPSPLPSPDETALSLERTALIRSALDCLGEPCREVIELRFFGDLSYEEIASSLELNPKTVSSRLSKCLDQLAKTARKLFSREKGEPFSV